MATQPIDTKEAYLDALREISALMDLDPDVQSPKGARLSGLVTLVQAYEAQHYPMTPDT